jgi:hypothetical protein
MGFDQRMTRGSHILERFQIELRPLGDWRAGIKYKGGFESINKTAETDQCGWEKKGGKCERII